MENQEVDFPFLFFSRLLKGFKRFYFPPFQKKIFRYTYPPETSTLFYDIRLMEFPSFISLKGLQKFEFSTKPLQFQFTIFP